MYFIYLIAFNIVKELKSLEVRLQEVKLKLEKYGDLPANLNLAEQKIDSLKIEIVRFCHILIMKS